MKISMIESPECDLLFVHAQSEWIGAYLYGHFARVSVRASALADSPLRDRIIARARERAERQCWAMVREAVE